MRPAVDEPLSRQRWFWIGLAISAACLYLTLRQTDWRLTAEALLQADGLLLVGGSAALVATSVIFALRWRVLLSNAVSLPIGSTFAYIMIGYLANAILPMRLGDIARAALLGRRYGIGSSVVLGSVMLERLLDVLAMLLVALGLSLMMDLPPAIRVGVSTIAVSSLVALGGLLFLAQARDRFPPWALGLPAVVPRIFATRLAGLGVRFAEGLNALRDGRQLGESVLLSAAAWFVAGVGTTCWVGAFHLPVPWYAGLFVLAVVNLGGAIPSSPGAIGVYHYLAALALSIWVPDWSAVIAYAIATHGLNLAVNVVLGSICLNLTGFSLKPHRQNSIL